ncbi:hypothetical protein J6590_039581 [Homalodisca vitripennis]|nr:hypothetical protein J6590_039581 [Homalodisca vitripennis]
MNDWVCAEERQGNKSPDVVQVLYVHVVQLAGNLVIKLQDRTRGDRYNSITYHERAAGGIPTAERPGRGQRWSQQWGDNTTAVQTQSAAALVCSYLPRSHNLVRVPPRDTSPCDHWRCNYRYWSRREISIQQLGLVIVGAVFNTTGTYIRMQLQILEQDAITDTRAGERSPFNNLDLLLREISIQQLGLVIVGVAFNSTGTYISMQLQILEQARDLHSTT